MNTYPSAVGGCSSRMIFYPPATYRTGGTA
jgi:hypothetical protein